MGNLDNDHDGNKVPDIPKVEQSGKGNERVDAQSGHDEDAAGTPSRWSGQEGEGEGTSEQQEISYVPLDKVHNSQAHVSYEMKGGTIDSVASDMKQNGWDRTKGVPDMVDWGNGEYQTLDHRRIEAARRAGLQEVPARLHSPAEGISDEQAARLRLDERLHDPRFNKALAELEGEVGKLRGVEGLKLSSSEEPRSWGEAVLFRSARQRVLAPEYESFPLKGQSGIDVKPPRDK